MKDYSNVKEIFALQLVNEAEKSIANDEGFRDSPYKDSMGHWSIGYGFNIEAHPQFNVRYMTKAIALQALDKMIDDIIVELKKDILFFDELDDARKVVLINMAFNLGVNGLLEFKHMLLCLKRNLFKLAAEEIRNSLAAHETGNRYQRLAEIMESGII